MADQTTLDFKIGYEFTNQYYAVLVNMPHELHRFYGNASLVSRPGSDEKMTTVDIEHAAIDCRSVEISTVDSQFCLDNAVMILVTGNMVRSSDNVKKGFVQSFLLDKPEGSPCYYVMNDIFKFFIGNDSTNSSTLAEEPIAIHTATHAEADHEANCDDEVTKNQNVESKKGAAAEEPAIPNQTTHVEEVADANNREDEANHVAKNPDVASENSGAPDEVDSSSSNSNEEVPKKKSFAAIVSALSKNQAPFKAAQPKNVDKPRAHVVPTAPSRPSSTKSNIPPTIVENNTTKPNSARHEVKASHAVYVAYLPMSATVEELGKLFARFGAIKRHGIQVRRNDMHGTCFAFVDFELASAMQSAIKASPIAFASRSLSVQEKRANNTDKFRGRGYVKNGAELGANSGQSGERSDGEIPKQIYQATKPLANKAAN